jgi:hypothetical protein
VAERALAARRGFLPCGTVAWGAAAGLADSVGGAVWTLAAGAGAVRAKTIANPTVASAPSWVVRQVSLPSRRNPASRVCAGESS